jgi:prophage regulatory protein
MTLKQVCSATGLHRQTVNRRVTEGTFPHPVRISKTPLWMVDQIERWCSVHVTDQYEPTELLRVDEVCEYLQIGKSLLYQFQIFTLSRCLQYSSIEWSAIPSPMTPERIGCSRWISFSGQHGLRVIIEPGQM